MNSKVNYILIKKEYSNGDQDTKCIFSSFDISIIEKRKQEEKILHENILKIYDIINVKLSSFYNFYPYEDRVKNKEA